MAILFYAAVAGYSIPEYNMVNFLFDSGYSAPAGDGISFIF